MASSVSADEKRILTITYWGVAANLALMAAKAAAGALTGSVSLIADAVHSGSDLATDGVTILGVRLGARAADASHPYGHGKLETFAAIAVAVALLAVGGGIAWAAGRGLYLGVQSFPGPAVIVVAAISIVLKEALFWVTRRVALATGSPVLAANAWHHRSDALSSIAVALGGVGGMLGWGQADDAAGLVVGAMVVGVGVRMLIHCGEELSEHAVDERTEQCIIGVLETDPRVLGWHNLRTRRSGRTIFLDCHILVDPALSVVDGHVVAEEVKARLATECPYPADILIHIEPDIPALRRV